MPWTSEHIKWLRDTGERLLKAEEISVEVWEFHPANDDHILSAWAKHFRNHYCLDCEIDDLRTGTGLDRSHYLTDVVFPNISTKLGPSIRAGDFAEILIADYLEFILKYWVPRTRYDSKAVRDESTKGIDIIGFKIHTQEESLNDTLFTFEAKAKITGNPRGNTLQDAVNGSAKDCNVRKSVCLNALKRRFIKLNNPCDARKIERFQNKSDRPYQEMSGAAAVFSTSSFDEDAISNTDTSKHPNKESLYLLIIHGEDLMPLVHQLYRRAADEA